MGEAVLRPGAQLGRSQSLKSKARIGELFRKAKKRSGSRLTVFYCLCETGKSVGGPNGDCAEAGVRVLIAVPKRTGNAVLRNKMRRRLREEFRLWDKRGGLAGELIVRYNPPGRKGKEKPKLGPSYDRAFYGELREEFRRLLEYAYNNTV